MNVPQFTADDLSRLLPCAALIEGLRSAFRDWTVSAQRYRFPLERAPEPAELLLMPADWDLHYVVKVVGLFPHNSRRGKPTIRGSILLCSALDGEPLAILDAGELTARRTAAASALAADYLARRDAADLLVVGSGRLVAYLAEAHATVRPIRHVRIWARDQARARSAVEQTQSRLAPAVEVLDVSDMKLEQLVPESDVVSTATSATEPLVLGSWLHSGMHLDLVGSHRDGMREADVDCLERATVFVDTRDGAMSEAGEIIDAVRGGRFSSGRIAADLSALARGQHPGRVDDDEITLFKSVGCALEDLAASLLAFQGSHRT